MDSALFYGMAQRTLDVPCTFKEPMNKGRREGLRQDVLPPLEGTCGGDLLGMT